MALVTGEKAKFATWGGVLDDARETGAIVTVHSVGGESLTGRVADIVSPNGTFVLRRIKDDDAAGTLSFIVWDHVAWISVKPPKSTD